MADGRHFEKKSLRQTLVTESQHHEMIVQVISQTSKDAEPWQISGRWGTRAPVVLSRRRTTHRIADAHTAQTQVMHACIGADVVTCNAGLDARIIHQVAGCCASYIAVWTYRGSVERFRFRNLLWRAADAPRTCTNLDARNLVLFLVYLCIPARQWTDICNTRCSILSRFSHFHVSHFLPLKHGAAFSCPASSCLAFSASPSVCLSVSSSRLQVTFLERF